MPLSDDRVSDLLCPNVRLRQHRRVWRSLGADSAVATPMMRSRSYLGPWLEAEPLSLLAWYCFNLLHLQGAASAEQRGRRSKVRLGGGPAILDVSSAFFFWSVLSVYPFCFFADFIRLSTLVGWWLFKVIEKYL